ncbi:MAG: thiamine ABC transporter substrate binding subunit [Pseudomonadota bacterium]|nr:thiamine ABC transporter substrate binding subunit [Pseudomonadota bacterium]
MKTPIIAAGLVGLASVANAQETLTVYTYDSFVAEWGPGPVIEEAFESRCDCDLEFVAVGDGAEILSRLRLEGARTEADVVLGLDENLAEAARETALFAPHGVESPQLDLPIEWEDDLFLPFDWGYFAFVYDKTKLDTPPASFEELADSDLSILIQDPRSSTPGLGLVLWIKAVYGEEAGAYWERLNDRIVTVTKGWSEAYGMFVEGEADMVLSYTTSPAYHLIAEDDDTKASAAFDEGHYMQIEIAGKVASTDQGELADMFLDFMLTDGFQSAIPTTNWMYPAKIPAEGLPEGFETLQEPENALIYLGAEAEAIRDEAIEEWRSVSSR